MRLKSATERAVEATIENGDVVRMHLLRPTWHFVARKDVRWVLELTEPNIRLAMKYRDRQLQLTDETVRKSNRIIEKTLRAGPVTRDRLVSALEAGGIANYDNRAAHLLMRAELDKVACSAPPLKGKQAYVFFDAWIPPAKPLRKEEALVALAQRYFSTLACDLAGFLLVVWFIFEGCAQRAGGGEGKLYGREDRLADLGFVDVFQASRCF